MILQWIYIYIHHVFELGGTLEEIVWEWKSNKENPFLVSNDLKI